MLTQERVFPFFPRGNSGEVRRLTIQEKARIRMSAEPITPKELIQMRHGPVHDEPDEVQRVVSKR